MIRGLRRRTQRHLGESAHLQAGRDEVQRHVVGVAELGIAKSRPGRPKRRTRPRPSSEPSGSSQHHQAPSTRQRYRRLITSLSGRSGEIAQLVEHTTENRGVPGSIPGLAIARGGELPERSSSDASSPSSSLWSELSSSSLGSSSSLLSGSPSRRRTSPLQHRPRRFRPGPRGWRRRRAEAPGPRRPRRSPRSPRGGSSILVGVVLHLAESSSASLLASSISTAGSGRCRSCSLLPRRVALSCLGLESLPDRALLVAQRVGSTAKPWVSVTSSFQDRKPLAALKGVIGAYGRLKISDHAAALTYFSILAVFPGMIVFVSLLGIFGDQGTVDSLLGIIQDLAPGEAAGTFEGAIEGAVNSKAPALAFIIGVALALYSASGYIGAFSRATNDIYEVSETRPFWKTLPRQVGLTAFLMLGLAAALLALVLTGPLAESIGEEIGVGDTFLTVFSIVKWPVLAAVVSILFAILLHEGPNVERSVSRARARGLSRHLSLAAGVERLRLLRRELRLVREHLRLDRRSHHLPRLDVDLEPVAPLGRDLQRRALSERHADHRDRVDGRRRAGPAPPWRDGDLARHSASAIAPRGSGRCRSIPRPRSGSAEPREAPRSGHQVARGRPRRARSPRRALHGSWSTRSRAGS